MAIIPNMGVFSAKRKMGVAELILPRSTSGIVLIRSELEAACQLDIRRDLADRRVKTPAIWNAPRSGR